MPPLPLPSRVPDKKCRVTRLKWNVWSDCQARWCCLLFLLWSWWVLPGLGHPVRFAVRSQLLSRNLCRTWDNSGDTSRLPHQGNISVSVAITFSQASQVRAGFSINIRQEGIILNWQVLKTIPQCVITYFNFYLWETLYSGQSLTPWDTVLGFMINYKTRPC